jgi:DNA-binding NarL/FixJ family response regulator
VKRIRIVLAGMSRMMLEMIEAIIASQPDFYIAGRIASDGNLGAAARRHRADVLIVMQPDDSGSEINADQMFWRRPSKVLAIAEGGRKGVVFVLRPHAARLGELSADKLVEAVRSASQA